MGNQGYSLPMTVDEITSLEMCYRIADVKSETDQMSARAISYAAHAAYTYRRHMARLAWACKEKNTRKRNNELQIVLMELDNAGERIVDLPSREYPAA